MFIGFINRFKILIWINTDPHIPVERIYATTKVLRGMNASVTEKVYHNMRHTIHQDEIRYANKLIFNNNK